MDKKVTPKVLTAILSAGMLSFLGILDETATTVTFPTLIREFGITTDQVQWVNTLVLLVIATIVPISSQIRLRIPTKRIFFIGVIFFAAGLLIDIFTPRFDFLLLGRALQGVGTGIGLPLMYNIILARVPKQKLGFMMGIGTMITAAAVALGPVFGGTISELLNWRWIFIISAALLVVSLICGMAAIDQINELKDIEFKYGQWLTIALGLVFLMIGFTRLAKHSFLSLQVGGLMLIGVIFLFLWVRLSWNDPDALLSPKLFKNSQFSLQLMCYCFAKISTLAIGFVIPIYVELVNHGSVSLAGWITLPGAITDAVMSALAGKMLDKKGARLPILVGVSASLTSLVMLSIWGNMLSNLAIMLLYVLYYGGYGMCFSSLMTNGLTALPKKDNAQGNAIFNTLQQFSGAAGTALAGTIIAINQGNPRLSECVATAGGARQIFIVLLVLIMVNLIVCAKFVKNHNK